MKFTILIVAIIATAILNANANASYYYDPETFSWVEDEASARRRAYLEHTDDIMNRDYHDRYEY